METSRGSRTASEAVSNIVENTRNKKYIANKKENTNAMSQSKRRSAANGVSENVSKVTRTEISSSNSSHQQLSTLSCDRSNRNEVARYVKFFWLDIFYFTGKNDKESAAINSQAKSITTKNNVSKATSKTVSQAKRKATTNNGLEDATKVMPSQSSSTLHSHSHENEVNVHILLDFLTWHCFICFLCIFMGRINTRSTRKRKNGTEESDQMNAESLSQAKRKTTTNHGSKGASEVMPLYSSSTLHSHSQSNENEVNVHIMLDFSACHSFICFFFVYIQGSYQHTFKSEEKTHRNCRNR